MEVRKLSDFLLASLFGHFCLLLLFYFYPFYRTSPLVNAHSPLWIQISEKAPRETRMKRKRIVETTLMEKSKTAPRDAFLGAQNQIVSQESVHTGSLSSSMNPAKRSVSTKVRRSEPRVKNSLSRFGLPILPPQTANREEVSPLLPVESQRVREYVKGMKESDRTALSTQEYLFYGYFQRIRERLDHAWVPILRHSLQIYYTSGRQLASDMDHTTRLLVILNDKGEIIRVKLLEESGVRDLDEAAVRAFNKAGPFPNPPRGIIDSNREVQIPWDFILKT